jgi:hypothetical protein
MLSIGPRKSINITKANPHVTVGNNSYFSISGDGTNPKIILSKLTDKDFGRLLLIECSLALGFTVVNKYETYNTDLSKTHQMKGGDTLLLVWSGRWVELSFSKNS